MAPFTMRWAVWGISEARFSSALEAPCTLAISIQWPSSMMAMRVESSQKNGMPGTPSATAML